MPVNEPFKVDKAAIERFIDKSNSLYEALGLQMGAPYSEIESRTNALRRINTPQYIHLVSMRATEITEVLGNAAKRKEYDRTIREITRGALRHYLDSMVEDDNVLDDKELAGYFRIGSKKGLPQAELQSFLDDYLKARSNIKVGGPGAAAAAPPSSRAPAPPAPPAPSAPAPSRGASSSAPAGRPAPGRMRPADERSRWVIASTASAGVLGAIILVMARVPFSLRMFAIVACIGFGIASLRQRKDWRAWVAAVVAVFAGAGHPALLGAVVGIIGVSLATMATHALGGRPLMAAGAATAVFAASIGIGLGESRGMWNPSRSNEARTSRSEAVSRAPANAGPGTTAAAKPTRPAPGVASQKPATTVTVAQKVAVPLVADPANVDVFVDGRRIGTTPITCNLEPGRHVLRFNKESFDAVERVIVVDREWAAGTIAARTIEVSLVPSFVERLSGRWTGAIDGKPLVLSVARVNRSGELTGSGSVTLASGEKGFNFEGRFDVAARQVRITDLSTGMEFTGSLADGPPPTMSGSARLPNVPLERTWKVGK